MYNGFRIIEAEVLIEVVLWVILMINIGLVNILSLYYISKKKGDYTILLFALALICSGPIVYIYAADQFVEICKNVLSACYIVYIAMSIMQYRKIKKNKSSKGISIASYRIDSIVIVIDIIYFISKDMPQLYLIDMLDLIASLAIIRICNKYKDK
jgi:hypothetical protein